MQYSRLVSKHGEKHETIKSDNPNLNHPLVTDSVATDCVSYTNLRGILLVKAQNIQEYRHAWEWHINQLAVLALAADVEYSHYIAIKQTLENWLAYAIEHQSPKDLISGNEK